MALLKTLRCNSRCLDQRLLGLPYLRTDGLVLLTLNSFVHQGLVTKRNASTARGALQISASTAWSHSLALCLTNMVDSVLDRLGEEVTGIVSPVSLCMALTVGLVRLLNPTGDAAGNSVYIASAYYKEQVRITPGFGWPC